jgi:alpha-tubulin suppressor-like RCC1 family protein
LKSLCISDRAPNQTLPRLAAAMLLSLSCVNVQAANSSICAGDFSSAAVRTDGTLLTRGSNAYGELGDGTLNDSSLPTVVAGLTEVAAVSAGSRHMLRPA